MRRRVRPDGLHQVSDHMVNWARVVVILVLVLVLSAVGVFIFLR